MNSTVRNSTRWTLYCILPFILVLLSSTFVLGQPIPIETQTSFPITITSTVTTTGGDQKLQNLPTYDFSGKIDLYNGNGFFAHNADGCYISFVGDDGTTICITTFYYISAAANRNKKPRGSDPTHWVGTGTIVIPVGGVVTEGIVYLDVKGSFKYDPLNVTLLFNGKIGGGGPNFVFTGDFKSTFLICDACGE